MIHLNLLHTVSVTLTDTTIDRGETVALLRHRLAQFQLLLTQHQGRTVPVLSIEADDSGWLSSSP